MTWILGIVLAAAAGLGAALLVVALQARRRSRDRYAGLLLRDVRRMSGLEFEHYLAYLFRRLGYKVKVTPYEGDFGTDLILTAPSGVRTSVQAKQWKRERVGVEAIQQAIAGAAYYNCQEHMVVTTNTFTMPARAMAQRTGTLLWSGRELADAIERAHPRVAQPGRPPLGMPKPKPKQVTRQALPGPIPRRVYHRQVQVVPMLPAPGPVPAPPEHAPQAQPAQLVTPRNSAALTPAVRSPLGEFDQVTCPRCGAPMGLKAPLGEEL